MDLSAIVTGGISGLAAIIVCVISNHYQDKSTRDLLEYRLKELEKKVDKHNSVVERTFKIEEQLKTNCRRLGELEYIHKRVER